MNSDAIHIDGYSGKEMSLTNEELNLSKGLAQDYANLTAEKFTMTTGGGNERPRSVEISSDRVIVTGEGGSMYLNANDNTFSISESQGEENNTTIHMSGGGDGQLIIGKGQQNGSSRVEIEGNGSFTLGEGDGQVQMWSDNTNSTIRLGSIMITTEDTTVYIGTETNAGTLSINDGSSNPVVLSGSEIEWRDLEVCIDGTTTTIQVLAKKLTT
jgi:hypothetical protein